jgi:Carboxypeptidase regulatory-like domain
MRKVFALPLFATYLLALYPAWSQEVTASFTGSVVDPSGASVVGATLTAKDTDRGTTYEVKTNGVGVFSLPRVPVGT